jgi:hypothetical protein
MKCVKGLEREEELLYAFSSQEHNCGYDSNYDYCNYTGIDV